jgi:hypothetical protein
MILAKQGRRTATGLAFAVSRVAGIRERAHIPAGPHHATGSDTGVSIHDAARQFGVCTQTIRRWLREGLLPAEQAAPHAPWRIRLTDDIRRRFMYEVPDGYVRLGDAAARTGLARQTILNQFRRGDRDAIHVTQGHAVGSGFNFTRTNKACCRTVRTSTRERSNRRIAERSLTTTTPCSAAGDPDVGTRR